MAKLSRKDGSEFAMAPRPNIPVELTSFVGRTEEVAEVLRLLASSRLLTITGAAGCGKTRLALHVATEVKHKYADGVHWVELGQLTDPQLVTKSVAKTLEVAEQPGRALVDGIAESLSGKQLLLVLDNCEHVIGACIRLVESLSMPSGLSMLMTSREPLGVVGEALYPLSPMALPPPNPSPDEAGQYDAIELFVERAQSILPHFTLTPENAAAVATVCRHLDGLPLAIELASARMNALTVEQIEARLEHRFRFLGEAAHKTSSHHRTLRAALDWSYDFLSAPEQRLLLRLSVFAAGCSLATAEAVCAGENVERQQVLELLTSLISKSLVVAQTLRRTEARYSLLETIRQYAQEKLVASGEWPAMQDRLLECLLQLTEDAAPELRGPDQQVWLDWLEGEYENIRTALTWSLEGERIEEGLRMAVAIYQFWTVRDYVVEGLAWLERLLAQAGERVSPVVRANALAYAAFLAGFRRNTPAQMKYGQEATVLAQAAGKEGKPALRWALAAQAYGAHAADDFQTEFALGQRVIALNRELGDDDQLGTSLSIYSIAAMALEEYEAARKMLDESLALQRRAGNAYRIAMALNLSGDLARCRQNYSRARAFYEESLSIMRDLDAVRDLASVLHNLGHTSLHLGDVERAKALFDESIGIQQAQRNRPGVAECLIGFAAVATECGLPAAGARLLAAAVAIGGRRITTTWAATRMEYDRCLSLVRARLTEEAFRTEQAIGTAFTLEQAIEYARNLPLERTAAHMTQSRPGDLSPREREVAILIAEGKSNGEIAGDLVLSKRTVEKHIAHIRAKLEVTQRAQIVRWVIDTGLADSHR
ncbi:MAG TPA: LuxR C-terminal-related transcriptional regulator [Candidatus Binatia bacterium]|nr:LuxR C-terminal-related transcriptional regulator [Candidatus Binatia bacterium]